MFYSVLQRIKIRAISWVSSFATITAVLVKSFVLLCAWISAFIEKIRGYRVLCALKGTSLVAQKLKHLPAMWETWVQSLGWEDHLEKERLPTPVFWPGEFHEPYGPWGHKESDMTEWLSPSLFILGFPGSLAGKESAYSAGDCIDPVWFLGQEDSLEKG